MMSREAADLPPETPSHEELEVAFHEILELLGGEAWMSWVEEGGPPELNKEKIQSILRGLCEQLAIRDEMGGRAQWVVLPYQSPESKKTLIRQIFDKLVSQLNREEPAGDVDMSGPEKQAAMDELNAQLSLVIREMGKAEGDDPIPIVEGGAPRPSELDLLRDMFESRRPGQWISSGKQRWERLLDACIRKERKALEEKGVPQNRIDEAVRFEWARWDRNSGQFVTELVRPRHDPAVPVVMVRRGEGFGIHREIHGLLWQHPLLINDILASKRSHPREGFTNTLKSVDRLKLEHDLDDWEVVSLLAEEDDPDRWAARCVLAAMEIRLSLEVGYVASAWEWDVDSSGGSADTENLHWLAEAKKGRHLWRLLNEAVELGRAMGHYSMFRDSMIEDAIQHMLTANPGKKTSPEGKAMERIVEAYQAAESGEVTSSNLLRFLGGTPPKNFAEPLKIDHSLWVDDLRDVSWERMKNLVKAVKRRMNKE